MFRSDRPSALPGPAHPAAGAPSPSRSVRTRGLALGLGLSLGLLGCTGEKSTDSPAGTEEPDELIERPWAFAWTGSFAAYIPAETPEAALELCLGLSGFADPEDDTDNIPQWSGNALFATDAGNGSLVAGEVSDHPDLAASELGHFCRVTAATPEALEMSDPATAQLLAWTEQTRSTLGEPIELSAERPSLVYFQASTLMEAQQERTLQLVGSADTPLAGSSTPDVRVIVADSEPSGAYQPTSTAGFDDHGRRTSAIVYNLLCGASTPTSDCSLELRNELALPFQMDFSTERSRDEPSSGGAFGSHMSLARALRRATTYVRAQSDGLPTLLNLSLGWNGGHSSPVDLAALSSLSSVARVESLGKPLKITPSVATAYGDLSVGERAVLMALLDARCEGLLPIAATGNRTNLPSPDTALQSGSLYPAAWMDLSATGVGLGSDPCTDRNLGGSWDPTDPLVYAISAVDQGYHPADLGRPDSSSVLAALGVGVTVTDPTGTSSHMVVSGTSASAALATAATALAWSADPSRSGDDRIQEVYRAGPTSTDADTRADVTPAVGAAAFGGGLPQAVVRLCEVATAVGHPKAPASCTPVAFDDLEPSAPGSVTDTSGATLTDCSAAASAASAPCGARYEATADVLEQVWPQPIDNGCPSCDLEIVSGPGLDLEGRLTVSEGSLLQPFWHTSSWLLRHELTGVTLELVTLVGATHTVSYGPTTGLGLFEAPVSPATTIPPIEVDLGTPLSLRSANLVITARNTVLNITRTWNVPIPLSAN